MIKLSLVIRIKGEGYMSNQNVKDSLVKVGHGIVKVGSKTKDVALESKDKSVNKT